jgi:hypothetical protein
MSAPWTLDRLLAVRSDVEGAIAAGERPTKVLRRRFREPLDLCVLPPETAETVGALFNLWGVLESTEGHHDQAASLLKDALRCTGQPVALAMIHRNRGCALIAATLGVRQWRGEVTMMAPAAFPDLMGGLDEQPSSDLDPVRLLRLVPKEFQLLLGKSSEASWQAAMRDLGAAARLAPDDGEVAQQARLAAALFGLCSFHSPLRARIACLGAALDAPRPEGAPTEPELIDVMGSALAELSARPALRRWLGRADLSRSWERLLHLTAVPREAPAVRATFRGYAFRPRSR